jgi:hypothetical protein
MKSVQKLPSPGWHAWSNQWTRQDDYTGWIDVKKVPPIPEAKTTQMGSDLAQGGLARLRGFAGENADFRPATHCQVIDLAG